MMKRYSWTFGILVIWYFCFHITKVGIENDNISKTSLQDKIKDRVHFLKENCHKIRQDPNARFTFYPVISEVIGAKSFRMCKVPKCGCTFWLEVFLLIINKIGPEDVFRLDREDLHWNLQDSVMFWDYIPQASDVMMMVTRDPWQRIYSAYMDKIYRVQSNFIELIAEMTPLKQTCAKIPTFQEFLDYIIETAAENRMHDIHWQPISNFCRVCSYNYSYIIKQENFVDESAYVLDFLMPGTSKAKDAAKSVLSEKYQDHSLYQLVRQFVSEGVQSTCFDKLELLRRLWVSLQSQGFISKVIDFDDDLFSNITNKSTQEIIALLIARSKILRMSSDERKLQRYQFLMEAYRSVKLKTLYDIQNIYKNDFMLFEYDQTPPGKHLISPRLKYNEM